MHGAQSCSHVKNIPGTPQATAAPHKGAAVLCSLVHLLPRLPLLSRPGSVGTRVNQSIAAGVSAWPGSGHRDVPDPTDPFALLGGSHEHHKGARGLEGPQRDNAPGSASMLCWGWARPTGCC